MTFPFRYTNSTHLTITPSVHPTLPLRGYSNNATFPPPQTPLSTSPPPVGCIPQAILDPKKPNNPFPAQSGVHQHFPDIPKTTLSQLHILPIPLLPLLFTQKDKASALRPLPRPPPPSSPPTPPAPKQPPPPPTPPTQRTQTPPPHWRSRTPSCRRSTGSSTPRRRWTRRTKRSWTARRRRRRPAGGGSARSRAGSESGRGV